MSRFRAIRCAGKDKEWLKPHKRVFCESKTHKPIIPPVVLNSTLTLSTLTWLRETVFPYCFSSALITRFSRSFDLVIRK